MPTNRYFRSNYFGAAEQKLYEDLIIESIKAYGMDMLYIPREYVALDRLYGEDKLSAFRRRYEIEMYVNSVDGFEGELEVINKFVSGLQIGYDVKFSVSMRRFREEVLANEPGMLRPNEGDIIFFPLDGRIYEVKFVNNKENFYQAGTLYTYELQCRLFKFGGEKFNTGITQIDGIEKRFAETTELVFTTGSGAFLEGERAYQGADPDSASASGEVVSWDPSRSSLTMIKVKGTFLPGVSVISETSDGNWSFDSTSDDVTFNTEDAVADQPTIKSEGRTFIDFSESNPYSE